MDEKTAPPKDLATLTRPYSFILREGGEIREDLLDYSLLLVIGRPETIRQSNSASCLTTHFANEVSESLPQEMSP